MTTLLLVLLVAFQVIDWWTTRRILTLGGYERNPVVRWFMVTMTPDVGLVASKAAVVALGLLSIAFLGPYAVWVLGGLCAVYAVVVAGNLRVIGRLK